MSPESICGLETHCNVNFRKTPRVTDIAAEIIKSYRSSPVEVEDRLCNIVDVLV